MPPFPNKCPFCELHCSFDDLRCPRGRFFLDPSDDERDTPPSAWPEVNADDAKLLELLRRSAYGYRPRHDWNRKLSQRRVLKILERWGDMTQRELINILGIRSASLSELLSKIEGDGFIERSPNEHDKRSVSIHLTESGRTAAEEITPPDTAFRALTDDEKASLTTLLEKLLADWDAEANAGPPPQSPPPSGFGMPPFFPTFR
ncbi:MAG: MarR family transcriptional regulator [Oscillospiraceae bacterium]|jgi:DNA-binding MarR family transcriptional regulator|nr:MarR family transcriptional regulator [Oscillospiraceae bacterium]